MLRSISENNIIPVFFFILIQINTVYTFQLVEKFLVPVQRYYSTRESEAMQPVEH